MWRNGRKKNILRLEVNETKRVGISIPSYSHSGAPSQSYVVTARPAGGGRGRRRIDVAFDAISVTGGDEVGYGIVPGEYGGHVIAITCTGTFAVAA